MDYYLELDRKKARDLHPQVRLRAGFEMYFHDETEANQFIDALKEQAKSFMERKSS